MTQERYFQLKEDCFLVEGAKRGALYNLAQGDVYSISEAAKKLISKCEGGASIKRAANSLDLSTKEAREYLESLIEKNIADIREEFDSRRKSEIEEFEPSLEFLWAEITGNCNMNCKHCYNESGKSLRREKMKLKDWTRVLKDAMNLGCSSVQFTGGEPLLEKQKLFKLIRQAHELSYKQIEVFTNATLLDKEIIQSFKKLGVEVAVSFYDKEQAVHEQITQKPGSYEQTLSSLKDLKKAGIKTRISIIVMALNYKNYQDTIEFLKRETGIENIDFDFIRPIGGGKDAELTSEAIQKERVHGQNFRKVSKEEFRRRKFGHNCFSRDLVVDDQGDVYPCIMAKDTRLGNIIEESLVGVYQKGKAKRIRRLNKDKIDTCKDCEYRYACFDCRPAAQNAAGGNLKAKPPSCSYNPFQGEWEDQTNPTPQEVIK